MVGNVIIVGGGKVGAYLAGLLRDAEPTVRIIEARPERVARLRARGLDVVEGSGTDADILERSGVRAAGSLVAVTGTDETNLAVASLARHEFAVPKVIARVVEPRNAWMFGPDLGVDVAVNQAEILGHLVRDELSLGAMTILLELRRGQFELVEETVPPDAPIAGRSVDEIHLPDRCVIVGVLRAGELLAGRGDLRFMVGDEVLAVVHSDDAPRLAAVIGGTAAG